MPPPPPAATTPPPQPPARNAAAATSTSDSSEATAGSAARLAHQKQVLRVAQAELESLRAGRAVYVRRGAVFFRSDKPSALAAVKDKLSSLEGSQ